MKQFFENRNEPMVINYRVNAGYLPLSHWLHDAVQGGGRIVGEGCHFVDFLTFMTGEIPQSVCAKSMRDGERYCQDNVILSFTYPDGSIGSVSYLSNGDKSVAKESVEVFCGGKVALLDDFRKLDLVKNGRRSRSVSYLRQDKGHQGAWKTFLHAISQHTSPPIAYDEIIGVTQATFTALTSLASDQCETIQLPD